MNSLPQISTRAGERTSTHTSMRAAPPRYCFIVGLPRTGTKLMVNVLEAAPNVTCCMAPENFFLGRAFLPGARKHMRRFGDLRDDANVRALVNAMYSRGFHGEYWDRLANGTLPVAYDTMLAALLASDRSDRAIYTTLLHLLAPAMDQATETPPLLLGDKTGPHLYHVPTLLKWFPDAQIIHTFRDPRAILASEHKKRLKQVRNMSTRRMQRGDYLGAWALRLAQPLVSLLIVVYITTAWLRAAHLHERYQRRYPDNYKLSRFEDLVGAPASTVTELCRALGLEFDAAMLNPPRVDSSFARNTESGFDPHTLDRWQSALPMWMKRWLRLSLGSRLRSLGYPV